MTSDLVRAVEPVIAALVGLGVRHYVGGSIASSAHGIPRASIDADLVADLELRHAAALAAALASAYYVPDERMREAIVRRTSFNVIHLATMMKVDVFVSKGRPADERAFGRVTAASLEEGGAIPVSSPEDTLLAKLEWYRKGGEQSERQWTDIRGLVHVCAALDHAYVRHGALELGVVDLWDRVLNEVRPPDGH